MVDETPAERPLNTYEERQAQRRERMLVRADRLQASGNARWQRADERAAAIPFGQPILVGHHSEGRDRRYRERISNDLRRGAADIAAAEQLRERAESVGSGGISSDDPDAVAKLRAQLEDGEQLAKRMKAVNAAHKRFLKNPASLDKSDLSETDKALVRNFKPAYTFEPHPFPPYKLSNHSANLRRIRQRIEDLERQAATAEQPARETALPGLYTVTENFAENRLQLRFAGKPAEAVRHVLKRNGFRWAPSAGVWQRMLRGCPLEWVAAEGGYIRLQIEKALGGAL